MWAFREANISDRVETDLSVRRIRLAADTERVVIAWDYPGSTLLDVRILRSRTGFAAGPAADADPGSGQRLVYEDVSGSFSDTDVEPGGVYFYTVYAAHPGGEWREWARLRATTGDEDEGGG